MSNLNMIPKRDWLVPVIVLPVSVFAFAGLIIWLAPNSGDRFMSCMSIAEQAGLLEARSEDAALICLHNATSRGKSGAGDIPVYIVGSGATSGT